MKYKNIIFDFGNVIGRFNGLYLLRQFCSSEEDVQALSGSIYGDWASLDKGTVDYETYVEETVSRVPERLEKTVRTFFREWPGYVDFIPQTVRFIDELKETDAHIYLLSNASTYFAEWFSDSDVLKKFDGIVFSAPLKMAKPEPGIYRYLFETFQLVPEECFFIDDLKENIEAGLSLGMDGIIFKGDIEEVRRMIGL